FDVLLTQLKKEKTPTFVVTESGAIQGEVPVVRAELIKEIRKQASLLRAKAFGRGAAALKKLKDLKAKKDAELVQILKDLEDSNLTAPDDQRVNDIWEDVENNVADMRLRSKEDTGTDMP
ncbi:MAG: hypothetical protein GTN93_18305, partial [Anaerolineae bacterium]|nr:hypothetical protein [Anaerolineae bacterium]